MSHTPEPDEQMDLDPPLETVTTSTSITPPATPTPPPAPPPSPVTTNNPPAPPSSTPDVRQTPQTLTLKILLMIVQNGLAFTTHRARPHSLAALTALRSELVLHSSFFDPTHRPEELAPDTNAPGGSPTKFTEIIVLVARLLAVLVKIPRGSVDGESEQERRERIEVRRLCLGLPFFDRSQMGRATGLFGGDEEGMEDEGVVV